jgi:hypothetical protein
LVRKRECFKWRLILIFCLDIIAEFPETENDEELPLEYLCHPCYVNMLATLNSAFGIGPGYYYYNQLVLVRKRCRKTTVTYSSSSAPAVRVEASAISAVFSALAFWIRTRFL